MVAMYTTGSYDDHSVTISSDALGTLVFAGNGGSSAVSAIDATAAGDIFDNFDGQTLSFSAAENATTAGNAAMLTAAGGNNIMLYTLPSIVDGLSVSASYTPQGANCSESSYSIWINIYWSRRFIS